MNNWSETELVRKLSEGDRMAYGVVFKLYYDRLFHFSLHYLNDSEASRDVVQDVFTNIWEDCAKFSEVRNLSSWLYTACKNNCLKKLDHLKVIQKHADALKYRQLQLAQNSLFDLDTSPVTFSEINSIINNVLEQLPEQTRKIFVLSRYENKKNREIAEELKISTKTVEANMTKALKLFRKSLSNYLPIAAFMI
ncbi:RNA polymerase sigma-70 factor [Prolixibacteraceae bacterium JC049]|nr:RNA polymerase sigma-70 factor [Prolixibacteraceae bacterium JC049]